ASAPSGHSWRGPALRGAQKGKRHRFALTSYKSLEERHEASITTVSCGGLCRWLFDVTFVWRCGPLDTDFACNRGHGRADAVGASLSGLGTRLAAGRRGAGLFFLALTPSIH